VDFIIITAGLKEVLIDMKLKSNCVSLYNCLLRYRLLDFAYGLYRMIKKSLTPDDCIVIIRCTETF